MSDIWNNPMVNNALKAMSKEDLEKYKKIGEQLYGNINFEDSTVVNQLITPVEEAIAYVEEGIKSGLLPEDLEENEVILLHKTYGEEWYKRYGFTSDQTPEPGLSLQTKREIDEAIETKLKEAVAKKEKEKGRRKEEIKR
jgi:hypothetical protein